MRNKHILSALLATTFFVPMLAGNASAQSLSAGWDNEATATGANSVTDNADCGIEGSACVPGQVYPSTGAVEGSSNACGETNDPTKSSFDSTTAVNYGLLSVYTDTRASVGSQADGGHCGEFGAASGSSASSEFQDSLTIVSNTLPQGTPVKLKITMTMLSRISSIGVPAPFGCNGELEAQGLLNLNPGGGLHYLTHTECSGTDSQKAVFTIVSAVGAQQGLGGELVLTANTAEYINRYDYPWGPNGHTGIGSSRAPSVARYAVQVLTPGASYVALSGTTYPTK